MDEPTTFRAGDSVSWTRSLPAYPASAGWVLKYRLLWPSGTAVALQATAAGDDHAIALTSGSTRGWQDGKATLVAWVENGTDRVTLEQTPVTILPDLTVAATHDGRSQNRKALDDARSALASYQAAGQTHVARYEVAGRSMEFRTAKEIIDLIAYYERKVAAENAAFALLNGEGGVPGRFYYRAG